MTSTNAILDSNILIDISRSYQPALAWLQQSRDRFLVPSLVRMELVMGTRNKAEQGKITKLLKPYAIIYPNEADALSAMERFEQFHLSHRIEIMDCFIAALSVRLKLPVYSRNVRDLTVFGDVRVIAPY